MSFGFSPRGIAFTAGIGLLIVFIGCGGGTTPGIDSAIRVFGSDVLVVEAKFDPSISVGDEECCAMTVQLAELSGGGSSRWNVSLVGGSGAQYKPKMAGEETFSVSEQGSLLKPNREYRGAKWLFSVPKTEKSLTLVLPEGKRVNLSTIVRRPDGM